MKLAQYWNQVQNDTRNLKVGNQRLLYPNTQRQLVYNSIDGQHDHIQQFENLVVTMGFAQWVAV